MDDTTAWISTEMAQSPIVNAAVHSPMHRRRLWAVSAGRSCILGVFPEELLDPIRQPSEAPIVVSPRALLQALEAAFDFGTFEGVVYGPSADAPANPHQPAPDSPDLLARPMAGAACDDRH